MACEEAELYYRWQMLETIAKGNMPPGVTEDDLRAMEMPLPGEIEMVEQADGTIAIRRVEKPKPASGLRPAANFVCDTPDGE
jgi:hypothetical protein